MRAGIPHGTRRSVVIEGKQAYKEHARLDRNGQVLHSRKHRLTRRERKAITNGVFVKDLWKCCGRTRKAARQH
jgi:hypothetical protein